MKKKPRVISLAIVAAVLVLCLVSIGIMLAKGFGCSIGRYLPAKNGVNMVVMDHSPIQMSNRTDRELFAGLNTGDLIMVLHDGVAESYPGKTGAYAVLKLQKGSTEDIPKTVIDSLIELGWLTSDTSPRSSNADDNTPQPGGTSAEQVFDIAVSYANWTDAAELYVGALNSNLMYISSVQHLPIYKFDTLSELEQFRSTFGHILTMEHGYDEVLSFHDATIKYDAAFFDAQTLMLVYVSANSGSYRYGVNSVFCDGSSFCIHVEQTNNPEVHTDDMAGWFVTVAVPDSMIANCTLFDADLNNTH